MVIRTSLNGIGTYIAFRRFPRKEHILRILFFRAGEGVDISGVGIIERRAAHRVHRYGIGIGRGKILHKDTGGVDIGLIFIVGTRRISPIRVGQVDIRSTVIIIGVGGIFGFVKRLDDAVLGDLDEDGVVLFQHYLAQHQFLFRVPIARQVARIFLRE